MWYLPIATLLSIIGFLLYLCFMKYMAYSSLLFIALGLTAIASIWVKITANKYLKKNVSSNMSGLEALQYALNRKGLNDIRIIQANSFLGEYYDPRNNTIAISHETANSKSISACSIAFHELGHALQYKDNYFPIAIRKILIGLAQIIQFASFAIFFISIFGGSGLYLDFLIGSLSLSVLIQIFTLPMEINASIRAYNLLNELNIVSDLESKYVIKVLKAAAYTYIAGLLASILQLVRLILIRNSPND